jgi:AcrR family transcriptional regulator
MATKREQNKEQKREALLNAAAREFAAKSYYGTNCAQIAASAKVAVGTIYELFDDKQDLANKLFQRAYARYLQNFLAEVKEADPPEKQFKQVWRAFERVLETNRDEFLFTELQFHESYLTEASKTIRTMTRSVLGNWVLRLVGEKSIRKVEVETMFSIVIGSFTRQVKGRMESNTPMDRGFLDEVSDIIWSCLKAK